MPGRPRETRKVFHLHIHLRLYSGEDDDLLQFFAQVPKRQLAKFLKFALRAGNGISENRRNYEEDEALSEQSLENFLL